MKPLNPSVEKWSEIFNFSEYTNTMPRDLDELIDELKLFEEVNEDDAKEKDPDITSDDNLSQIKKDRIDDKLKKIWELMLSQNKELIEDALFVYTHYLLVTDDNDYSAIDKASLEELNEIWKKYR